MHPLRLLLRLHRSVGRRPSRLGLAAAGVLVLASAVGPSVRQTTGAEAPAASVRPGGAGQVRADALRGPTIVLSLSVGPPGTVTTVTGGGFPGLQPVRLQWSRGVPFVTGPVVAHDDGTFVTQFLVVSGDDVFGPRELQAATPVFGVAAQSQMVAQAPFLVVPHTARPPGVDIIRELWGTRPFWFRH
jgi:hypothetical protein